MKFRSVIELGGKTATGIPVPAEVVASLGKGKRFPVRVCIGGYTYRSTVTPYGDSYMIPLSAEHRAGAGVAAGDEVEVEIERDDAPRDVAVPTDFMEALDANTEAKQFFDGLSYSNKRRLVLSIEDAKTPETRQRRIRKAITTLPNAKS